MQNFKQQFQEKTLGHDGTLQSCLRTNDLELVGDGSHLTYFEMLGNFSFGNNDYENSVEMWTTILSDLHIQSAVHVHPDSPHRPLWEKRGFHVVNDDSCLWTDGSIGGYCCEHYVGNLEIGNLVNPLEHSTDVGFGWERLLMVLENKTRIDETSLFDQTLNPITRDHVRSLTAFWENSIIPGNKGRNYVCRRLLRRILPLDSSKYVFGEWIETESKLREKALQLGKKLWKRHHDKSPDWWWTTCGLTTEELSQLN